MNKENLKISIEEPENCRKKVDIKVPATEIKSTYNTVIKQFGLNAKIPGFRPGKAPKALIKKRFGEEINSQVKQEIVRQAMGIVFEDSALLPLTNPELNQGQLIDGQEFSLSMIYDVRPEFSIEYKDIAAETETYVEDEKIFEEELVSIRKRFARFEVLDRETAKGDFLKCSMEGKILGEEMTEEMSAELNKEETWVGLTEPETFPGSTKAIEGHKKEDVITFETEFPEDWRVKFLAGKKAEIKITILEIHGETIPELDQELCTMIGVESVDKLKEEIKNGLKSRHEAEQKGKVREQVMDYILNKTDCPFPPTLLKYEIEELKHEEMHKDHQHTHGEECNHEQDEEKLDIEKITNDAQKNVKRKLILSYIAEQENIKASDEEVKIYIQQMTQMHRLDPKVIQQRMKSPQFMENLREQILLQKALDQVADFAKVKEIDAQKSNKKSSDTEEKQGE